MMMLKNLLTMLLQDTTFVITATNPRNGNRVQYRTKSRSKRDELVTQLKAAGAIVMIKTDSTTGDVR